MYDKITDLKSGKVRFHEIKTDKFKMSRLSFNFILPADREGSPKIRLMLATLMRGCRKYPSVISINKKLDEIYGATVSWRCVSVGDKHVFKISSEMLGNRFRFSGDCDSIVERVCQVILDILFDPLLGDDGLLPEANFESEKKLAIDAIMAKINDQKAYASEKCKRLMFGDSPLGVGTEGSLEQIKNMTLEEVSRSIRHFLERSAVECYYYGTDDVDGVKEMIDRAFSGIERENIFSCGKEYCFECDDSEIKRGHDSMDVAQSRLNIGIVCDTVMSDGEYYAAVLFNDILGGSSQSKLFMNVREKNSLCYYCYSSYASATGTIMIACGIKSENRDVAYEEIKAQLVEMQKGNFSSEDIETAKRTLISSVTQSSDSPAALEAFKFRRFLAGIEEDVTDVINGLNGVTKEEIISVAEKVRFDSVYFLSATEEEEECEDE